MFKQQLSTSNIDNPIVINIDDDDDNEEKLKEQKPSFGKIIKSSYFL